MQNSHEISSSNKQCFLSEFDIIGQEPKLNIGTEIRNKTAFGGALCFIIYINMFIAILYFSQEIVFKKIPNTTISSNTIEATDSIPFENGTDNNFSIFIAVQDTNGNYINSEDGIYNINLALSKRFREGNNIIEDELVSTLNNSISEEPILIERCNQAYFRSMKINYLNASDWMCIKPGQTEDTSIVANQVYNIFNHIKLKVSKCREANCQSNEKISEKINGAVLIIKYFETIFDFREIRDFDKKVLREDRIYLFPDELQSMTFEILKIETLTDTGLILEDFKSRIFYQKFSSNLFTVQKNTKNVINLCIVNFVQCFKKDTIYRKYYKFQNLFAEMGGLYKSLIFMAILLNYYNDEAWYYERLIDGLFDVDDLYKYFQYFVPKDRKIFKKYRDSIILKNSKHISDIKSEIILNPSQEMNNNYFSNSNLCSPIRYNRFSTKKVNNYCNYCTGGDKSKSNDNSPNRDLTNEKNKEFDLFKNDINKKAVIGTNKSGLNREKIEKTEIPDSDPVDLEKDDDSENNKISRPHRPQSSSMNYIDKIKKSNHIKDYYLKLKKKSFNIFPWDIFKFNFCPKKYDTNKKLHIISGGKEMINKKTDLIYMLKKNLEFDRFKNLLLKDYQILLLNSLSKFMLDPEQVNLIEYDTCTFDKMIDAYAASLQNNTIIDRNLSNWIRSKFHIE